MLFDGDGNRMTPTHATKQGRRYRYYVSRPLITDDQSDGSAGLRIPAREIEQAVTSQLLSPDLSGHKPMRAHQIPIDHRKCLAFMRYCAALGDIRRRDGVLPWCCPK
jgi:hypothetical protein